jgi:phosphoglycolate phosphatase-like HAD superfamily hydrolase
MSRTIHLAILLMLFSGLHAGCGAPARDPVRSAELVSGPLPSWRDGGAREEILEFIDRTTDPTSADFVPASDRLAVFDNDGTLWCEKPAYIQLAFAIDRVRAMADEHPEWRTEEPFRSAIEGDFAGLAASGEHGVLELVMASHGGMDSEAFAAAVEAWAREATHPSLGRRYVECTYAPMLELLELLRSRGFTVAICSGGGADFLRVLSQDLYGLPPELVVGSRIGLEYVDDDGPPRIERRSEIDFLNDKAGKPVGIFERFGRRPILAVGNSDGDFEMLEWTTSGEGPRLGVLLHHTDAEREFAYDRTSPVGRLARGLDEASSRGWIVIDMTDDWSRVFAEPSAE